MSATIDAATGVPSNGPNNCTDGSIDLGHRVPAPASSAEGAGRDLLKVSDRPRARLSGEQASSSARSFAAPMNPIL
jgi:hypothetical protein